jgi:uncharacterized repeat protein (TIGR01451 family)/gliding motility-associated-like protein
MKILKRYIRLVLSLVLLAIFLPQLANAQVVLKGFNSATATGTALGKEVNDNSNTGTVVNKLNDDPTPIVFPMIGLAKTAGIPVLQSNGTYNVTYTLRVQNYSTVALNNIQIIDDLKTVFPDNATNAKYTIASGAVTVLTSDPINDGTGAITVNPNFNGEGDKNLLIATTSSLTSNASGVAYFATIQFTINVDPKGINAAYNKAYNNTATVSASTIVSPDAPTVVTVSDISHNNVSPNEADITKTPLFYNTVTPVTLTGSDIQVGKTTSNVTPDVNTNITFTIKVRNNGTATAAPVVVNDLLPAGFEYVSKTVSQGTYDQATGIWSVGTLLVGAANEQTLTVTAKVLANKTVAEYTNTATANHPGDQITANNNSTVIITPRKIADLKITNTDGKTTYTPGNTNTYTIVVTNDGPSDVVGATVTNTLPTGFTGTWTAVYAAGSAPGSVISTGLASGTGSISQLVDMPAGSTVTYTYVVDVPSSYTGNYVNTATVTRPTGITDPTPANNTASDTDSQDSRADFTITKDDGKTAYTPGTSNTYTIVVSNTGPSNVTGATVKDALPTGFTGNLRAVYTGGATGTATGTATAFATAATAIDEVVNMPSGSTITYTLVVNVPSSFTGNLVNTATVKAPVGVKNGAGTDAVSTSASDTDTQDSKADLKISKTDGTTTFTPGTSNTYTIVVTNDGPSDVIGATVTDTSVPAGFTGELSAVYTGGATGTVTGVPAVATSISQTVNIPSGATITYTFKVNMPSNHTGVVLPVGYTPIPAGHDPLTSKYFINEATVAVPVGVTDATLSNNTASDADLISLRADLSITNTDGKTKFVPGTNNVYTITVDNLGPSDVIGAVIANALPTGVTVSSWTAVGSGGVVLNTASGSGAINQTENIPSGGKIVYTVTMAIPSGRTADVVSVATVTAPVGVTDPTPANNTSTDTDVTDKVADLKITNTDGKTQYTPGTSNTYTIVVTNDGPSDVTGATVTNTLPTGFTGATWTAVYSTSAAGTATGSASGTGSISELVNMPTGTTVTYTYVVNVPSGYTGNYTNTATVKAPIGVKNSSNVDAASVSASDTDTQNSIVDLKVEKIASSMAPIVNSQVKFTIKVTNVGPSDGSGISVTDKLNPGYIYISSVPSVGTYNDVTGLWTIGNLVYNQSVTLEVTARVLPDKIATSYKNTATVTGTENDPVLTNNTVTISPVPRQLIDLVMGKTISNTTPEVGSQVTFTLTVDNNGPSNATNVVVNDLLKAGYTYVSSTSIAGTYSPTTGIWTIGDLAVGGRVQLLVRAIVNANVSPTDYVNTAVVSGAEFEQILTNNTASVSIVSAIPLTDLAIVKVASVLTPSINSNVEFTLTATNNGPNHATGVKVTDLLTAGFRFVSATPSVGTYNSTTGIWNIGNLNLAATASLTINAIVNENGPHVNTATITGVEGDPNLTNNTSTVILVTQAAPVAVDDIVKACATGPVVIDILANDLKSVSNINPSTVVVTKQPTNGSVTIDPTTGKATYTPRVGYTGDDQFSYTVKDINGGTSNEAQVKITVNQAIVALNDLASTDPNLPVVIDILANDMVGSTAIVPGSIVITQQPVNGTITIDAAGKVTYTPKNNYVGTDSFKYTVKDVSGCTSNVATVDIRMNDLPKIGLAKAATSVAKQQNGSYNITYQFVVGNYGTSVLSNVSIKDDLRITFKGDAFSVKSVTSSGTLRVNPQYNGGSVIELLAAGNSLAVGDKQQLELVVNVVVGSDQVTYLNSAIAEGSSITGIKNTDVSTDGLVPDVNGDVSSSVPTPVDLSRPKQFIPEGFSPNGDGINDTFVIANAGNKRISLEIYNRWANRVYRSADYKNDWSGQSNEGIRISGDLPEGTYFYIVVIDGKDKYVGSITLKR